MVRGSPTSMAEDQVDLRVINEVGSIYVSVKSI